ncbi:zinc dependent phospholipase C family protein [Paenibacillus sacheonensis]|uniref:Hydrolase n=1 Tax=Paenibacillus sacheonensis TaxID=742054 RepID=A0A7X4YKY8_9BACL|nr:zinc dependent phospholipase C family protein [Paenibacillus sacheonensis]MBM7563116.1 hypothetical protein [Paenibacillus sacheonensis]NBC68318.1 hydrolase [Paenibacillus sacheonensis]
MGSRIMHLIIANRIAETLSLEDRVPFLIGSLAPDAVATKNESHFFKGDLKDFTRHVDFKGFLQKYREHAGNPYVLGYAAHLIADDMWMKGFNLAWLKNRMEADPGLYAQYHRDFRSLNGKLLEHYGYRDELRARLRYLPSIMDLEEVTAKDVDAFIPDVLGDMEYGAADLDEKLNVFTLIQIIGYIETSVEAGVMQLRPLLTTNCLQMRDSS